MMRRYHEVMEKVQVTGEMRERILDHIQNMDLEAVPNGRAIPFPVKRYLSVAACFVILLAGVFAAGRMTGILQPDGPNVMVTNGIEEVSSLKELSDAVGFEVEELGRLPFVPEESTYVSYWKQLAEITYAGEGHTAAFRMSRGADDNSGDCNAYPAVIDITVGSRRVTLKGDGGSYVLAIWSEGGYAYSVRLSDGVSESEWRCLIGG